jgi:hypothetical protein
MRLRTVSRSFVSALFIALAINLALLIAIRDASSQVRHAHQVLAGANALTQQVLRENDLLAQLVQSFTTTGDLRYLTIYYDIVAVREGERAAPTTDDAARYWREVVANRRPYASAGDGLAQSLLERMRRQHFSDAELQTARRMLDVLARMKLTEQIAFAQTQGLYDSQRGDEIGTIRSRRAPRRRPTPRARGW